MLATLSKEHPPGAGWVFERKLDGVRVIATRERAQAPRLWSRNQKSMDASYPEIVEALDAYGPDRFVLDGEIVAADGTFASLQARMHLSDPQRARRTGVEVHAHLFETRSSSSAGGPTRPARATGSGRCWSATTTAPAGCATRARSAPGTTPRR